MARPMNKIIFVTAILFVISYTPIASGLSLNVLHPAVEITLSNDGLYPIWFMCQMTDHWSESLHQLPANETVRFSFDHIAFPMRWCYLFINPRSQGFFWAYTVRSRCTKCFWSINKHPSLYRNDKGRWERQKLFMPPQFNISEYITAN